MTILKSDNLFEILLWLTERMSDSEMSNLFSELKVKTVAQLSLRWDDPEVKERVKREVRKRTGVKDCTFKLETYSELRARTNKYVPRTFIDLSSVDD